MNRFAFAFVFADAIPTRDRELVDRAAEDEASRSRSRLSSGAEADRRPAHFFADFRDMAPV